MLTYNDVNHFCFTNLTNCSTEKNGWVARCPICNDSQKNKHKRRFHLKFENDFFFYHCFNCNDSGNFFKLYAYVMGVSEEDAKAQFRSFSPERIKVQLEKKEYVKVKEKIEENTFDWILDDCVTIPSSRKEKGLLQILEDFKQKRKIEDYPLYVAYKGTYAGRIIIPVVENNKIIYFQGRETSGEDNGYKYLNPKAEKSEVILNKELFDRTKPIIITEGLIDAMSVENHQATSCLGAAIRDDYLKKIYKYTESGIIIALDNDPPGKTEVKRILEESRCLSNVRFFLMPNDYKDLNEVKVNMDLPSIYQFVLDNSYDCFKTSLLLKLKK